jgi:hypothetical protein
MLPPYPIALSFEHSLLSPSLSSTGKMSSPTSDPPFSVVSLLPLSLPRVVALVGDILMVMVVSIKGGSVFTVVTGTVVIDLIFHAAQNAELAVPPDTTSLSSLSSAPFSQSGFSYSSHTYSQLIVWSLPGHVHLESLQPLPPMPISSSFDSRVVLVVVLAVDVDVDDVVDLRHAVQNPAVSSAPFSQSGGS